MLQRTAQVAVLVLVAQLILPTVTARGDLLFDFDPGTVGTAYSGLWSSTVFDLDEPLGQVVFQVEAGKRLEFAPNPGTAWRLNVRIQDHGLSQNYSVLKTLALLDGDGSVLAQNQVQSTVPLQTDSFFISGNQVLGGIAAIRLTYAPQLPEVGDAANIGLLFNERSSTGVMTVTGVPEPSSWTCVGLCIVTCCTRRRRLN